MPAIIKGEKTKAKKHEYAVTLWIQGDETFSDTKKSSKTFSIEADSEPQVVLEALKKAIRGID